MEFSQCKENKAESVQLLSSAKLSLKQLITRVKVSEFIACLHRCQSGLYETVALSNKRDLFSFKTRKAVFLACLFNHNRDFRMTLEKSLRYSST